MAKHPLQGQLFDSEPQAPAPAPASGRAPDGGIGWRVPPREVLFPRPPEFRANVEAWRRILAERPRVILAERPKSFRGVE
jgi:hypothetical protein